MAKSSKEIHRLLTLIPFLNSRRGLPVNDVARELGVTTGQLLKDLDQLCLYGAPPFGPNDLFLATVDEENKLEIAYAEQFSAPLHLTADEAISLRLALLPLLAGASGAYVKIIQSILFKIDQALLPQDRLAVDQLEDKITVDPGGSESGATLDLLRDARRRTRRLEITYYTGSSGEYSRRRIDPYGFVLFGGAWYTVAFDHKSGSIRTFRVSRIKEASLAASPLADSYQIPNGFDITKYATGHIFKPTGQEQDVELWFSPKVARWVLERSTLAKKGRDGSATMTLKASNFAWIARWIMLYGPEAKILKPKQAQQELVKIVENRL